MKNNICQCLLDSEYSQVNFLAGHDGFWHLKPKLIQGINHHSGMESLRQLLGSSLAISNHTSRYTPKKKLILCYILANSMLYLYPGSWLDSAWSSDKVYFIRSLNHSTSPIPTFPYLSVELRQARESLKNTPHHMQCHYHPAILALGINFLEIVTGIKFERSREEVLWKQGNEDNQKAL